MEQADQDNPFESPTAASDPSASLERVLHLARLGWLLPLIGLGLFASILLIGMFATFAMMTSLNFFILLGVLACLAGGIVFTIYGMFWAQSYRALLPHVTAGLSVNFLLMMVVGGVMYALLVVMSTPYPE